MLGQFVNAVRRNHALEHGTVSILLTRLGPGMRLAGRAVKDGFYIYGKIPTDVLASSAAEALARLQAGESALAVTPLCGTNIAVSGVLTGLASVGAMGRGKRRMERLPNVFTAAMVGVIAAQPIGLLVQKFITTSPDLDGTTITGIRTTAGGVIHKVKTTRA
jgi:Domain of unknown function (DUF6391)